MKNEVHHFDILGALKMRRVCRGGRCARVGNCAGGGRNGLNIEWSTQSAYSAHTHAQNTASKSFPSRKAILSSETNLILCQSNQRVWNTTLLNVRSANPINLIHWQPQLKDEHPPVWLVCHQTSGFSKRHGVWPHARARVLFKFQSDANRQWRVKGPPGLRNTGMPQKTVCWTS